MSADNGIYILRTLADSGYEYRVAHLFAIDNLHWDGESYSNEPDVMIGNAREMWNGAKPYTEYCDVINAAFQLNNQVLQLGGNVEYGIKEIVIDRKF